MSAWCRALILASMAMLANKIRATQQPSPTLSLATRQDSSVGADGKHPARPDPVLHEHPYPVVMTADTWVTSHRYSGARAVPFQAVLQAGSAVLIDPLGSREFNALAATR